MPFHSPFTFPVVLLSLSLSMVTAQNACTQKKFLDFLTFFMFYTEVRKYDEGP